MIERLRHYMHHDSLVLINKMYLDKSTWLNGMKSLGRSPNWNQFSHAVINHQQDSTLPSSIAHCLEQSTFQNLCGNLNKSNSPYRIIAFPIVDASKHEVAKVVLTIDLTEKMHAVYKGMLFGSSVIVLMGIFLFIFFYIYLSKIAVRLATNEKKLLELARHDGLTKLYNHATFYKLLKQEISRSIRYKHALALLMIDIDLFKQVNDTYGHQIGDFVLKELSALLETSTRDIDLVCRYGGEEMAIIIPELQQDNVLKLAERLRYLVEKHVFAQDDTLVHITISIGVSLVPDAYITAKELISLADEALYAAKNKGRNQIVISTP
ncbi:MAG: GGDEF domain-containing protein [Legionellaceae bacterium]|nr:GGDEF domain-containing protein [Legionellaceae bacterium]